MISRTKKVKEKTSGSGMTKKYQQTTQKTKKNMDKMKKKRNAYGGGGGGEDTKKKQKYTSTATTYTTQKDRKKNVSWNGGGGGGSGGGGHKRKNGNRNGGGGGGSGGGKSKWENAGSKNNGDWIKPQLSSSNDWNRNGGAEEWISPTDTTREQSDCICVKWASERARGGNGWDNGGWYASSLPISGNGGKKSSNGAASSFASASGYDNDRKLDEWNGDWKRNDECVTWYCAPTMSPTLSP